MRASLVAVAMGGVALGGEVVFYPTLAAYEAETGLPISEFGESPMLAERVARGELPPVEERISAEPMVIVPLEEVGTYGGRLRGAALSPTTGGAESWTARTQPLFRVSSDLQGISPNVAKGWEFSDDYATLTVYLREGMRWSDGAPFTADDFLFWYEALVLNDELMPAKPRAWSPGGDLVEVSKGDDYTVVFQFASPYPSILNHLGIENRMYYTIPFAPKHYLQQFHIDYNPEANQLAAERGYEDWVALFQYTYPDEVQQRWDVNVPTVDPWTMTRVDSYGNKYFERNPFYFKVDTAGNQLPYIDQQDRLLYEDLEAINFQAISGALDYVLQFTIMDNFQLYRDNEEEGGYRTLLWYDGRGQVLANIKFNHNHRDPILQSIFQDNRFKQAVSMAVDREEINEVVWWGFAQPRTGTVAPGVSFYQDWMGEHYAQYDPEAANALLDDMGLEVDGRAGYRMRPDGSVLTINLEYAPIEGSTEMIAELLKEYWEAVGIRVSTRQVDQSLYWQRANAGEQDLTLWNLDSSTELGYHSNPFVMRPYAVDWILWFNSGGASGEQPPPELLRYQELATAFQRTLLGSDEYLAIGEELLTIAAENLWNIGTTGLTPKPALLKTALGNTPEVGQYTYDFRFWMIYHPDQWFWR